MKQDFSKKPVVVFKQDKFNKGNLVAFVHIYTDRVDGSKQFAGVLEDHKSSKKVVVIDPSIKDTIVADTPYEVELQPMVSGRGYICIGASRTYFDYKLQSFVKPMQIYRIQLQTGFKTITFDVGNWMDGDMEGKKGYYNCPDRVSAFIENSLQIQDKDLCLHEFIDMVSDVATKYAEDFNI